MGAASKIEPRFLEKVWGSSHLSPWFPDNRSKVGEVWLSRPDYPILIKFLFTSEPLSVQVHPDDAYGQAHHASPGKTEMWHILRAEPGAKIALGFKETVSPEQLSQASLSGKIMDLLQWIEPAAGDTFFTPAGTVHALGGGLALCEIQQQSDVTYRLYDHGRVGRELHLDHGLRVSKLGPCEGKIGASNGVLVSCPYFTTSRYQIDTPLELSPSAWDALIFLQGSGHIDGHPYRLGEAFHLTAPCRINPAEPTVLLHTFV